MRVPKVFKNIHGIFVRAVRISSSVCFSAMLGQCLANLANGTSSISLTTNFANRLLLATDDNNDDNDDDSARKSSNHFLHYPSPTPLLCCIPVSIKGSPLPGITPKQLKK